VIIAQDTAAADKSVLSELVSLFIQPQRPQVGGEIAGQFQSIRVIIPH
jgi:hypothetical protein